MFYEFIYGHATSLKVQPNRPTIALLELLLNFRFESKNKVR